MPMLGSHAGYRLHLQALIEAFRNFASFLFVQVRPEHFEFFARDLIPGVHYIEVTPPAGRNPLAFMDMCVDVSRQVCAFGVQQVSSRTTDGPQYEAVLSELNVSFQSICQ